MVEMFGGPFLEDADRVYYTKKIGIKNELLFLIPISYIVYYKILYLYFIHLISSLMVGFLPYINIPTRYIFAAIIDTKINEP